MFKVEWLYVVTKAVFKICFSSSYVDFLLIFELVWRDLYFVNDVWGSAFSIQRAVVLVSTIAPFLNLSITVWNFHIVVVYNRCYVLYTTVTYFDFVSIEYAAIDAVSWESRSNRLRRDSPIFIEIFLLNGELNHMIFLLCLLYLWWLVPVGLYVSFLLYPDCRKLFL